MCAVLNLVIVSAPIVATTKGREAELWAMDRVIDTIGAEYFLAGLLIVLLIQRMRGRLAIDQVTRSWHRLVAFDFGRGGRELGLTRVA